MTKIMNKEICTYYDELFEQQIIQKSVRQLPEPERQR